MGKGEMRVGQGGIELATFQDLWNFASTVVKSGMEPKGYRVKDRQGRQESDEVVTGKVALAIQFGQEMGFSPMQSLNWIAIFSGRPALWGDMLPALVWSSGVCEDIYEHHHLPQNGEQWGDEHGVLVAAKRKGASPIERRFTVRMAREAGLWGKSGPWQLYPARMLLMRAKAWAFRDAFPDALQGFAVAEEERDRVYVEGGERPRIEAQPQADSADSDPMLESAPEAGDPTQQTEADIAADARQGAIPGVRAEGTPANLYLEDDDVHD